MIYLIILLIAIILPKILFKINLKEIKKLSKNEELSKITEKFPNDIQIAKDMLKKLNNENVKIEQSKNTNTSLYITITNKISIADMKNNYARIQTIAHECIHSVQDRRLLLSNFIISNINIIYFFTIIILSLFRIINNYEIYAFVFLVLEFLQFSIRSYLEIDAMTKSKFLAKEYIEENNLCSIEEEKILIMEYEKINEKGIPFTIDNLLTEMLVKIIIFILICMII